MTRTPTWTLILTVILTLADKDVDMGTHMDMDMKRDAETVRVFLRGQNSPQDMITGSQNSLL